MICREQASDAPRSGLLISAAPPILLLPTEISEYVVLIEAARRPVPNPGGAYNVQTKWGTATALDRARDVRRPSIGPATHPFNVRS